MECTDYLKSTAAKEASDPYKTVGAPPSMRTLMRNAIAGLAAVMLAACGGEDGFFGTGATGTTSTSGSAATASVTMLVSSPQLGSSGANSVTVTAIVKDSNNVAVPDVAVVFSADSGTLTVTQSTTDATGQATATIGPGSDYTNRTITISALAGTVSAATTVNVVGTALSISGATSATLGDSVPLTIVLRDSDSNAISGKAVTISSANGNTVNASTLTTDSNGQVAVTVTATASGADVISASAQGATSAHALDVSGDQFQFTSPAAGTDVNLGTCQAFTINWALNSTPISGGTIDFSATRGTLYSDNGCTVTASSANTNASGDATLYIVSSGAGPTTITAIGQLGTGTPAATSSPSTSLALNFVAITPASLDLQVDKATIGPNDGTQTTTQQATLTAIVRDASNNLVKNQTVDFSIVQDISGGSLTTSTATTDSLGRASSAYVSSAATTAQNGVQISATVRSTAVTNTVSLTVAKAALFVRLGTALQVIKNTNDTTYDFPYSVIVTDSSGNPAVGKVITLSLTPIAFGKGYWYIETDWTQVVEAVCPSEDLNENGVLDAAEDINLNGVVDPGNIAAVPATVTIGADGTASFYISYAREYGDWVYVRLTAAAGVAGTEGTDTVSFWLPIAAEDATNTNALIPGYLSHWGDGWNSGSVFPGTGTLPTYVSTNPLSGQGPNGVCGDTL